MALGSLQSPRHGGYLLWGLALTLATWLSHAQTPLGQQAVELDLPGELQQARGRSAMGDSTGIQSLPPGVQPTDAQTLRLGLSINSACIIYLPNTSFAPEGSISTAARELLVVQGQGGVLLAAAPTHPWTTWVGGANESGTSQVSQPGSALEPSISISPGVC
jgi:hypothetical protein